MICDLPDLKQHLRVDGDHEDGLIQSYALAAERQVADWIGRPFYRSVSDLPMADTPAWHPDQLVADEAIKVSVMMLTARIYEADRAAAGDGIDPAVPPMSVRALLAGHRVFAKAADA